MSRSALVVLACLGLAMLHPSFAAEGDIPQPSSGQIERHEFNPTGLAARYVDVWLPEDYDEDVRHAVLYMHDGQNLFDPDVTWNGQSWEVDETLGRMMDEDLIRPTIVVGVHNSPQRHAEYFPAGALEFLPDTTADRLRGQLDPGPLADLYLSFLVEELKPFIDRTHATDRTPAGTFIAGSSMGGLISWYALCEYPWVFGGAACLSTHWIGFHGGDPGPAQAFESYLRDKLPTPSRGHHLYFDHGTVNLDAMYPLHQARIDQVMRDRGYPAARWMTRVFEGHDHNEQAWASRFHAPVLFLLGQ